MALMPLKNPPGSRSISYRPPAPRKVTPEWVAAAATRQGVESRAAAAEALPLSGDWSFDERAELAAQAIQVIQTISTRDLRSIEKVRERRDGVIVNEPGVGPRSTRWKGPAPPAGEPVDFAALNQRSKEAQANRNRFTVECEALAHGVACRAVKAEGPLRSAVAFLLSHPVED